MQIEWSLGLTSFGLMLSVTWLKVIWLNAFIQLAEIFEAKRLGQMVTWLNTIRLKITRLETYSRFRRKNFDNVGRYVHIPLVPNCRSEAKEGDVP